MTTELQERLKELCEKARYSKEMGELTTFVSQHKNEFIGGNPDAQRAVDDFALLTAWIYDILEGRKYDDKNSVTRRIKKASELGCKVSVAMQKYVHIIPIESITDAMCPEFKDEYVNGLDRNEARALCREVMLLFDFA